MISLEKWFEIEENVISQVKTLDFSNKGITELPPLSKYKNLTRLNCNNNKLRKIPDLPNNLKYLNIRNNQIEKLPTRLPKSLRSLDCANNRIKNLPAELPPYLKILVCNNNRISILPPLQNLNLKRLECIGNDVLYLYNLPSSLLVLNYDVHRLFEDPLFVGLPFQQKKIFINGYCIYTNSSYFTEEDDAFSIYFSESNKSNFNGEYGY